jgi:hypothetical protein
MPDFSGDDTITLQPGDLKDEQFTFSICSSATANDGMLPYGTTIASAIVTCHNEWGTANLEVIALSSAIGGDTVAVRLDYPAVEGPGNYHIEFNLTLDDAQTLEFDFNRIYAKDL